MLNQGCRPEELLSLRKDTVDLEQGSMGIVHGKSTAARRTLKLLPESRSILATRMDGDSPWIFTSPVKPGFHVTKLNNAHARVLEDTGLNFVIYDLRHTAATRWAERGMPLATLANILGRSNLRSGMKYVHPSHSQEDLKSSWESCQQSAISFQLAFSAQLVATVGRPATRNLSAADG